MIPSRVFFSHQCLDDFQQDADADASSFNLAELAGEAQFLAHDHPIHLDQLGEIAMATDDLLVFLNASEISGLGS